MKKIMVLVITAIMLVAFAATAFGASHGWKTWTGSRWFIFGYYCTATENYCSGNNYWSKAKVCSSNGILTVKKNGQERAIASSEDQKPTSGTGSYGKGTATLGTKSFIASDWD